MILISFLDNKPITKQEYEDQMRRCKLTCGKLHNCGRCLTLKKLVEYEERNPASK